MFKRSLFLVLGVLAVVLSITVCTNLYYTRAVPSSYDTGKTIGEAFKTSNVPLLVEFYSDSCNACRQVTPLMHQVYRQHFSQRLTWVMLDANDDQTADIASLFKVDALPAVFVFDHHHMKKFPIAYDALFSEASLQSALTQALRQTQS